MTQQSQKRQRKSFTLKLSADAGTTLAEIIEYLNSLDKSRTSKKLEDILFMALLPLARQHSQRYNIEQLRMTCLESCDALEKHSSYLRQMLMVPQPQFEPSCYSPLRNSFAMANSTDLNQPKTQINGQGSSADIDLVFGDD